MASAEQIFWELHRDLPQQGPGSDTSTLTALRMIADLPDRPRIADMGCGPGRQTLTLAAATRGHIVAIDLVPSFLRELERRAAAAALMDHIEIREGSMLDLALDPEAGAFDLIWSEGAIYSVGFATGLRSWLPLLTPKGAVAVTELSWLRPDPSDAVRAFWTEGYPAMQDVEANCATARDCGYEVSATFTLPDNDWTKNYYDPLAERIKSMRHATDDPAALAVLDAEASEIEAFHSRDGSYGYVFYVLRRAE